MKRFFCWFLAGSLCVLVGCGGPKVTRIDLTTYDETGTARHHYTEFTRASYRRSPSGTVELVLRSDRPARIDPTQTITQVFYVKELWKPQPGTTYAEPTQINARVQYAMFTPPTGVRYDGVAFITYRIDKLTGELAGWLESGSLAPRYRMGDAALPFGPARFTGTIRATENPADVVKSVQTLDSLFAKRPQE